MARFTCGLSGIVCEVSHVPMSLNSREYAHPIFFMPKKKLLGLVSKAEAQELGDIDSYLLYLALFNSTDLVEFRVPAKFQERLTPQIVSGNLSQLCEIVYKLDCITTPAFQVPKFAVTPETSNLQNSHFWIAAWDHAIESFLEGNKRQIFAQDIAAIEERIYRHILDPNTKPQKYASALAYWASKAAQFPEFCVDTQFGNMTCSEYWQLIIRKCINEKAIFDIPKSDIEELITHCEENLELGTIYSHSLLKLLQEGSAKQIAYLGLGDLDVIDLDVPYTILEDSSSVMDANLKAVVLVAPPVEPKRTEYPSEFEYQRARIRYLASLRTVVQTSKE